MRRIILVSPNKPKEGLMGEIAKVLDTDGLMVIQKRVVTIENGHIFYMETPRFKKNQKIPNSIKRNLGPIPENCKCINNRCYAYITEEDSDDRVNVKNTMELIAKEYGSISVSGSALETTQMEALLFS